MAYKFSWLAEESYLITYCKTKEEADDLEESFRAVNRSFTRIEVEAIPEGFM